MDAAVAAACAGHPMQRAGLPEEIAKVPQCLLTVLFSFFSLAHTLSFSLPRSLCHSLARGFCIATLLPCF